MDEELWKYATDNEKIEWLRTQMLALQKKCDELQKQVDGHHSGQAAINEKIRFDMEDY